MVVDLRGLSAVVTGGGTGIGRAIAVALSRCGSAVTIGFRASEREALETVGEIDAAGGDATAYRCDVTDEGQIAALMAHASSHAGGVDILVANAGTPLASRPTEELTGAEWDEAMAINCRSVFYCVKHTTGFSPTGGVASSSPAR